jgi:PAS domain S-box-containing protein
MSAATTTRAPATETYDNTHERPFAVDELFFSTTDPKGFIRTGNEVFVRVSGYGVDELIGRPHNVIRHPHTPRVVFRLLWEHIAAGEPIVAYVKNRAKDGAHYWVLAAVRPIDGGYLSVRLKPTSPLFTTVKGIYAELHALEREIEDGGGTRSEAMDAAAARLAEILHAVGMADYQEFMRTALAAEVLARRSAMGAMGRRVGAATGSAAVDIAERLGARLNDELDSIEEYMRVNEALAERSEALVRLAEEGQVLAINAVLASRRLGTDGGPLVAVAKLMQQTFPNVVARSRAVVERISTTRAALQQLGFEVAFAVLQNDMSTMFLDEVVASDHPTEAANMRLLIDCLRGDVHDVLGTIHEVAQGLETVGEVAGDLIRNLGQLDAIERNGRVEATRTSGADAFRSLLDNTRERVDHAKHEIREVVRLAGHLDLRHVTELAEALGDDLEALHDAVDGLSTSWGDADSSAA